MQIDMKRLVPGFIWADRNGRAMCKALEAGLKAFAGTAEEGLKAVADPESMPEWRLDEMAWEFNIPYSYTADVEAKRGWVRDAYDLSRLYGTAEGIARYIGAHFDGAEVLEAADYGGEPYHYKVTLNGARSVAETMWAVEAARTVQNVRSVLDEMRCELPVIETDARLYAGAALYGAVRLTLTSADAPDIGGESWLYDDAGAILADESGVGLTD